MKQRRADHQGRTFVWDEHGTADDPAVVLVHGFPDGPETWTRFAGRLVEHGFRVVAPALRGYAPGTAVAGEPSTPATAGGDLIGLLDLLGIEEAAVVGHDWGASAAYAAAGMDAARLSRVVAIGVPHPRAFRLKLSTLWSVRHFLALGLPGGSWRVSRGDGAYLETLARRWAPTWGDGPRSAHAAAARARLKDPDVRDGALQFYRDFLGPPDRDSFRRCEVPGLVVVGEHDLKTFDEGAFRHTPDVFDAPCRLEVIDDAGHWPHLEKPEEFEGVVVPFLSEDLLDAGQP